MKFRKKPVIVEAWRWRPGAQQEPEPPWISEAIRAGACVAGGIVLDPDPPIGAPALIYTLEGVQVLHPGDWIIRGVAGELYGCRNDIFEATYESLENRVHPSQEPEEWVNLLSFDGHDVWLNRIVPIVSLDMSDHGLHHFGRCSGPRLCFERLMAAKRLIEAAEQALHERRES